MAVVHDTAWVEACGVKVGMGVRVGVQPAVGWSGGRSGEGVGVGVGVGEIRGLVSVWVEGGFAGGERILCACESDSSEGNSLLMCATGLKPGASRGSVDGST